MLDVTEPTLLLLYSDGLVESRHADIDQGIARLAQALDAGSADPVDGTEQDGLRSLSRRLLAPYATGDTGVTDDRTLLLAELTPLKD